MKVDRPSLLAVIVGASVLLISGCSEERTYNPADYKAEWRELPDGSQFASVGDDMTDWQIAERCWPEEGKPYRCIHASRLNAIGGYVIELRNETKLPTILMGSAGANNGYTCSAPLGMIEEIKRDGKSLVSNQPGYGTPRWSKRYVAGFMADNHVNGQRYFPCIEILNSLLGGSIETLSTTEVTKAMAGA